MIDFSRLQVEQRIREYDLHLRHVDELMGHAAQELAQRAPDPETGALLAKLKADRDRLAGWLEDARRKHPQDWRRDEIRQAGPMGIWDAIAQSVEELVERIER